MAKFEQSVYGSFDAIVNTLDRDIQGSGLSVNLVDESDFRTGDTRVAVRVYDKYYARNSNRTSLSLTVVGTGNTVYVSAIGAGGGSGVFLNFSFGAESDFVYTVERSMRKMGF